MSVRIKPVLIFLGSFALLYLVLIAPWPGWKQAYGESFRAAGNTLFGGDLGRRVIRFQAHTDTRGFASIDTRILLGNRDLLQADGKMPVVMLGADSRGMSWIPTALTMALILATPVSLQRRAVASVWGLVFVHVFIFFTFYFYILDESPMVKLATYSPLVLQVLNGLEYTLVESLGASLYVPVLIWMLVTFREEDFKELAKTPRRAALW